MNKQRSSEEVKAVRNELQNLVSYSLFQADSLANKDSRLYRHIIEMGNQAQQMLEIEHYPTIACVARLKMAVKHCWLDELILNVADFKKILKDYEN